ncbi:MAG: FAD:protein FMN transferase, partial [Planctomycetota bacterium]
EAIEEAHALLTRFERGSVVSRLNDGSVERMGPELFGLFEVCERVREESGGLFDVTRGGALALDADERTVRVVRGDVDMGAVGKGFAIDTAIGVLRDAGVAEAFVHAGTSTCAGYREASDEPWTVRVGESTGLAPLSFDVSGRALAVSGDEVQGAHIVDPRDGARINGGVFGACVGLSATLCDAWSTALAVARTRPDAMPDAYQSIVIRDNAWRVEPLGSRADEEMVA